MSGPLYHLFGELYPPPINLIDRFEIFAYSVHTLRGDIYTDMLVQERYSEKLERVFTYPLDNKNDNIPPNEILALDWNEKLEEHYIEPVFLSNTVTNSTGIFTFIHGLVFYEKITPSLVEQSKDRVPENIPSVFEEVAEEIEEEWYSPVVFCVQTQSNYVDFFYELLLVIYQFTYSLSRDLLIEKKLVSSLELLKSIVFVVENAIIPPVNFKLTMSIGEFIIRLPTERSGKFPHFEQSLIVLLQVLSIERIIEIWEIVLLNNQLIVYGSNDTLIYAVIHALHQLIFPLTWNMNIFIGMNYSKRNYLGCITPFIAGVNKNRISVDDLKKYAKNVYIVDLDSDSTCLVEKTRLCECQKRVIYNKLFLAKVFYFSGSQRLHAFRLNEFERLVGDEKFKTLARKMNALQDQYKKDKAFGVLIRKSFFKLLKNIRNYKDFIEIELKNNSFRFNKEEFLASIKVCKASNCTLVDFFQNLVETQSFQTFLDYYKKFDQSYFSRFRSIIEKKRTHSNTPNTKNISQPQHKSNNKPYSFTISQKMHSLALVEILRKVKPTPQSANLFEDESFRILIEKTRNTLLSNSELYDSSQHPAFQKTIQKTLLTHIGLNENPSKQFKSSPSSLALLEVSKHSPLIYGEKGFLRLSKICFQGVKQENFSVYLEKYRITEFEKKTWQGTLLKFLYVSKYFRESEDKFLKLFKLLKKLSQSNPSSFPCYHAVKVIEKLSQSTHIPKDDFLNIGGIFSKLAKQYFLSLENPSSFYKLIVSNSINGPKPDFLYSTLSFIE